jgi:hypothetical protein
MPGTVVQFDNKQDVIDAYESMDIASWGLFTGRYLNFSYSGQEISEGKALLASYLDLLQTNQERQPTPILFSLHVYDLPPGQKVNSKTAYSAAFNFQLIGYGDTWAAKNGLQGLTIGQINGGGGVNKLLIDEIKAMRLELAEMKKANDDDDDDDDGIEDYGLGKIGKAIQHPMVQQVLTGLLSLIPNRNNLPPMTPDQPNDNAEGRKIAGVPTTADEKIDYSLDVLCNAVSDFPDILMKLAAMAQKKPGDLNFYVNALRAMNI